MPLNQGPSTQSFGPMSGGKWTGFNNLTTAAVQVIGINANRQKIGFHNPGTTLDIYVNMSIQASGAANNPAVATPGGAFRIVPGGYIEFSGECQGAWEAFVASGTTGALTIIESNI